MQKDFSLSICMWTGLACLGWLKQCRSNLECVLLSTSKPRQGSQPWKSPAKGKYVPPEAGKNKAPLAPACSKHAQHYGTPGISTPCSAGALLAQAGRSAAGAGGQPSNRLGPRSSCASPGKGRSCVRWAPHKEQPVQGRGEHTRQSERFPTKVSGPVLDSGTALLDRHTAGVPHAAPTPCQDWLPFR